MAVLTIVFTASTALAEIYSGSCGNNATYTLDTETGLLKIVGKGEMKDYDYYYLSFAPWYDKRSFITKVEISDGITGIGDFAFCECSALESVTIPNSVTSIGAEAFYGCFALTSVTIPESVTSIGRSAFRKCFGLTNIIIPNCVTIIKDYTFEGCKGLTSVTIPNSVTRIEEVAFSGCSKLNAINIPDNLITLGERAFEDCSAATSLNIGESVTSIGDGAFSGCSKLTAINIPDNVMTLGRWSFDECSAAKSLKIGDNVEVIPANCFQNCTSLEDITLGSHVMNINDNAFAGDRRIATIKTSTFIPPTCASANVFDNYVYQAAELYVPTIRNAIARYKADGVWSKFFDIYEQDLDADPIYLEIKGMDGGVMKLLAEKGKEYTFVLEPMEDWIIHSVTFNGKDVTNNIINNIYNTPGITEDSELIIIFEEDPNAIGIKDTKENNIRVRAYQNVLEFVNSGAEEEAHIYTLNGMLVKVETINTGTTRIPMESHQTYIIRTASSSYKVSL